VKAALAAAVSDLGRDPIGIGLTTQRSTVILWDRQTGRPLSAALSWQDRRAAEICGTLSASAARIRRTTGLVLSPYYAAPKLRWLLDRIPGAQRRAERGDVLCGTVNTFLLWHLSDRRLHVTDHTHAARMLLMNLSTLTWDAWLCDRFGIPQSMLPAIAPTISAFGEIRIGARRVPVFASIGDQQAAAFGQGGARAGDLCLHYGTGAFALLLTGATMVRSPGLLTSIAWSSDSGRSYVLEGTVNAVGSGLAWLQRTWRLPNDLRALDRLARRSRRPTPFLPALAGLGAPDWDPLAEGIASGFTLASEPQDVVQGFLDGVAFLLARVVAAMPATVPAARITASGGLSELSALLQSQADFLGCPIRRARLRETSAWGAAALCGVGAGLWRSPDEAARRVPYDRLFHPSAEENSVNRKKRVWERLLREAQRIGVYTAVSHSE
jgi:glycerol kinase